MNSGVAVLMVSVQEFVVNEGNSPKRFEEAFCEVYEACDDVLMGSIRWCQPCAFVTLFLSLFLSILYIIYIVTIAGNQCILLACFVLS